MSRRIADGKANRDIGEILGLSPRTVNKHPEGICAELWGSRTGRRPPRAPLTRSGRRDAFVSIAPTRGSVQGTPSFEIGAGRASRLLRRPTNGNSRDEGRPLPSVFVSGLVAVVVSFAGPSLIIFQAASDAHLSQGQLSSWIWAISIGSGVTAVVLSARYRAPIVTAWSTPGAALSATALPGLPWAEAVGAFVFAAALITLLGASGLFERITAKIPAPIAAAMLAGIPLRFSLRVFSGFPDAPLLVGLMPTVYLVSRRFLPRYAVALVLVVGVLISAGQGALRLSGLDLEWARPVWTTPEFTFSSIVGPGLPLALVTPTGQFVPGVAVSRAFGYQTPAGPLVWGTSLVALILAPFGAHGVNLAAITAAICSGPDTHPDPGKRWIAGVTLGVAYFVVGLFGATLAALLAAFPPELIATTAATTAGLAPLGALRE